MADKRSQEKAIARSSLVAHVEQARQRMVELESTVWDELSKAAEVAVERAERELRVKEAVIDASVAGLALWDSEGRISYVNPAFLTMWGYDAPESVEGSNIQDLLGDDPKAATIGASLEQVGGWIGKLRATGKDNSPFTIMLSVSLIRKDDGTPDCAVGSFVDMTYRERLNTMLFRQADWLDALQEIDRGILSGASLEEIAEAVLTAVQDLIPCASCSLTLLNPEAGEVQLVAAVPGDDAEGTPAEAEAFGWDLDETIRALPGREIQVFAHPSRPPLPPGVLGLKALPEPGGHALVPLANEGKLLGSLNVALEPGSRLSSLHESIARQLADSLTVAVVNAQLKSGGA